MNHEQAASADAETAGWEMKQVCMVRVVNGACCVCSVGTLAWVLWYATLAVVMFIQPVQGNCPL